MGDPWQDPREGSAKWGKKERAQEDFLSSVSFRFQIAVCSSQYWYRFLGRASHSVYTLGALGKSDYWICNLPSYAVNGLSIPDRICFWPQQGYLGDLVARSTPFTKQKIFKENFYGAIRIFPRDFRDFLFDNNERGNREKEKKKKRKGWNKYFRRESFKKRLKFA